MNKLNDEPTEEQVRALVKAMLENESDYCYTLHELLLCVIRYTRTDRSGAEAITRKLKSLGLMESFGLIPYYDLREFAYARGWIDKCQYKRILYNRR